MIKTDLIYWTATSSNPAVVPPIHLSSVLISSVYVRFYYPYMYMSIEEEEGKKEEDTGAVQGTLGPSASYIYIKNPFPERSTLFRI